jgi:hypothetical protein
VEKASRSSSTLAQQERGRAHLFIAATGLEAMRSGWFVLEDAARDGRASKEEMDRTAKRAPSEYRRCLFLFLTSIEK